MKPKNPKEHQSPFEKYFYKHLQNVQISLMELNQSIRSRKKDSLLQKSIPKIVEISKWQNFDNEIKCGKTQSEIQLKKKENKIYMKVLFLLALWILGLGIVMRQREEVIISIKSQEWERLVVHQSTKEYPEINIPLEFLEGSTKLGFGELCEIMKLSWLKDLKPYFGFVIEKHFINLSSQKEGSTKEFSIFDQNSHFINFDVSEIKRKSGIFLSFKLKISYLSYNFLELQKLSKEYLQSELIDKYSSNHFHLQQNIKITKMLQKAIHDFL